MKMKLIIGVVALAVIGGAAFVVASGGEKMNEDQLDAMRGTDPYYVDSELITVIAPYGGGEILTNIQESKIVKLGFEIQYRVGIRWQEDPMPAADALAKVASQLKSQLLITLSGREPATFKGAGLSMLRQEILDMINELAFPLQEARVEAVNLTTIFVQGG
ncbi:MAG: flagellar basal body-associated FliL family protein [Planctomycetota bacterium]